MSPIRFKTETILDICIRPLLSSHGHFLPSPLLTENLSDGSPRDAHYILYGEGGGRERKRGICLCHNKINLNPHGTL